MMQSEYVQGAWVYTYELGQHQVYCLLIKDLGSLRAGERFDRVYVDAGDRTNPQLVLENSTSTYRYAVRMVIESQ